MLLEVAEQPLTANNSFSALSKDGAIALNFALMIVPVIAVTASPAPSHYHLAFPEVEGLNFTFAGVDWNPMGHPPENVWTVPHFDFHFYLPPASAIATIPPGVATYDIPDALMPAGIDLVFTCGRHMAKLHAALPADMRGDHAADSKALAPLVVEAVRPGDVVMVKGSLGSRMARVVEALSALDAPTAGNGSRKRAANGK